MFRNEQIASNEKEKAQAQDKILELEKQNKQLQKELTLEKERLAKERKPRNWKFWKKQTKTEEFNTSIPHYRPARPFKIPRDPKVFFTFVVAILFISFCAYKVVTNFTDINAGFVTDKTYVPKTCNRDEDGYEHCTGPFWSVELSYRGDHATWQVSEEEYNRLHIGQWHCETGVFRHECSAERPAE